MLLIHGLRSFHVVDMERDRLKLAVQLEIELSTRYGVMVGTEEEQERPLLDMPNDPGPAILWTKSGGRWLHDTGAVRYAIRKSDDGHWVPYVVKGEDKRIDMIMPSRDVDVIKRAVEERITVARAINKIGA